jgi:hypothetical protein
MQLAGLANGIDRWQNAGNAAIMTRIISQEAPCPNIC